MNDYNTSEFQNNINDQSPFNEEVKRQKPSLKFSSADNALAWISLLAGFLVARTIPVSSFSMGAMLITIGILILSAIFIKLSGKALKATHVIFAAVIAIFSAGYVLGANKTLHFFLLFFILCLFAYWIYTSFGLNGGRIFCKSFTEHIIHSLFVVPLLSLPYIFPAFIIRDKKTVLGRIARNAILVLIGLFFAIIPTAIIILLLSYDKQFTTLLGNIFKISIEDIFSYIGDGIFGVLIAIILFAIIFGAKRHDQLSFGEGRNVKPLNISIIPRALITATVTPILAVYVIFFISQWDYYVSAFTRTLPEDLTYAEYARSGFFQLCWVVAINAFMLLLFNLLIKKKGKKYDPLIMIYSSLISLSTLVLIATALSKMLLYIDSFGLTRKRVYASWLIILLAVFFIFVLLKQFIKKLPLVPILAVVFAIFFSAITLVNTDSMIAQYNVNRYLVGNAVTVDVEALDDYGASAVPALSELHEKLSKNENRTEDEETLLRSTTNALERIDRKLDKEADGFFSFNLPRERARSILDKMFPDNQYPEDVAQNVNS